MCKLNLIEINGDIEQFSANYQDCQGAQGVVTITKNGTTYSLIGNNTAGENFETELIEFWELKNVRNGKV